MGDEWEGRILQFLKWEADNLVYFEENHFHKQRHHMLTHLLKKPTFYNFLLQFIWFIRVKIDLNGFLSPFKWITILLDAIDRELEEMRQSGWFNSIHAWTLTTYSSGNRTWRERGLATSPLPWWRMQAWKCVEGSKIFSSTSGNTTQSGT